MSIDHISHVGSLCDATCGDTQTLRKVAYEMGLHRADGSHYTTMDTTLRKLAIRTGRPVYWFKADDGVVRFWPYEDHGKRTVRRRTFSAADAQGVWQAWKRWPGPSGLFLPARAPEGFMAATFVALGETFNGFALQADPSDVYVNGGERIRLRRWLASQGRHAAADRLERLCIRPDGLYGVRDILVALIHPRRGDRVMAPVEVCDLTGGWFASANDDETFSIFNPETGEHVVLTDKQAATLVAFWEALGGESEMEYYQHQQGKL